MDSADVRGTLNTLLYGIIFARELGDDEVQRIAGEIDDDRRARFREAIAIVLRDGHLPAQTLEFYQPHTQAELLDFLARVSARLA